MPPRYTIRQVVGTYRRKAFGTCNDDGSPRRDPYPPAAVAAFYGMLELAEEQPVRGVFESERLLRTLLEGPEGKGRTMARQVPFLIEQGDLIRAGTTLSVEGWQFLQEGSDPIRDRMGKFNGRVHQAALSGAERTALWRKRKAERRDDSVTGVTSPGVTGVTSRGDERVTSDGDDGDVTRDVTSPRARATGLAGAQRRGTRLEGEGEGEGFTTASSPGDARDPDAALVGTDHQDLDDLPWAVGDPKS